MVKVGSGEWYKKHNSLNKTSDRVYNKVEYEKVFINNEYLSKNKELKECIYCKNEFIVEKKNKIRVRCDGCKKFNIKGEKLTPDKIEYLNAINKPKINKVRCVKWV